MLNILCTTALRQTRTLSLQFFQVNQDLWYSGWVTNTTQTFSEIKFRKKKNFLIYGKKKLVIQILYNFLYGIV